MTYLSVTYNYIMGNKTQKNYDDYEKMLNEKYDGTVINEKKQEKYYDLVPIYSRLPNITKKKEKR